MIVAQQQVSIIIATHGADEWHDAAWSSAYPSAREAERTEWGMDEVIIHHVSDGTLAQTRNDAAALARKPWLCFLDADDMLAPDYLEKMAPALQVASSVWRPFLFGADCYDGRWDERVPMQLLAPAVSYVQPDGTHTSPAIPNKGRWPDMNECVIGTLIPRIAFDAVGGFRELPSLEDYDLFLRCVKRGLEIVHVPDAVYFAAVHRAGSRNADQSVYPQLRREHADVWSAAAVTA